MSAAPDLAGIQPDPFYWCLDFVLRWEGGYVDDPADHGGATNRGITQATYDAWRESLRLPPAAVRFCSLEDTRAIYRTRYWDAVNADALALISPRIALVCFDAAVQSGPGVAARTLQRVVRAHPDGVVGPVTLARTRLRRRAVGEPLILEAFMDRRRGFYGAILLRDPTQRKFLTGWKARRNALRAAVGLAPEED